MEILKTSLYFENQIFFSWSGFLITYKWIICTGYLAWFKLPDVWYECVCDMSVWYVYMWDVKECVSESVYIDMCAHT